MRCLVFASGQTMAPPSKVLKTLVAWKLRTDRSPCLSTLPQWHCDAEGVRSVVDHLEVVGVGDSLDRIDVARMAVAVHRHDRRRVRRDRRLDPCWIEVERLRVDVDEHRLDAVPEQRVRRGDERERRRDHLARDAQRLQRRHQRDRAIGEQRDVLDPEVFAQRRLELLVERAHRS